MKIISFQGSKHSTQISFSVLSDQSKCTQFKDTLFKCDKPAFRKANNASDYQF
ncbi:unnamed protein product [Paramecium sonneborni]|uniref:Uncharacterized protein n=1 Tax=Paramecium sonneborni TaxID=65129 RepID=A0A8S1QBR5_9CILI|nr:unnamed protein product [Paramecium sonneborni]